MFRLPFGALRANLWQDWRQKNWKAAGTRSAYTILQVCLLPVPSETMTEVVIDLVHNSSSMSYALFTFVLNM